MTQTTFDDYGRTTTNYVNRWRQAAEAVLKARRKDEARRPDRTQGDGKEGAS